MPICHDVHKLSSSKKPSVQVLFWAVTRLEAHLQQMFPDQWRNLFMLPYFRSAVRIKHHCIGYLSQQFHRGRGKGPMLALAPHVCYLPMAPRYWLQDMPIGPHKLSCGVWGTKPHNHSRTAVQPLAARRQERSGKGNQSTGTPTNLGSPEKIKEQP